MIYRSTLNKYAHHLTNAERIIAYRLETRSTGSECENYGPGVVPAIKRDKYSCTVCGQKDVRCLEIDHIKVRKDKAGNKITDFKMEHFQTLCATHHRIKTVIEKQQN